MRLLFIAPNPPGIGRAGGATILYNHLKRLADRHRIDLVTFQRSHESMPAEIATAMNRTIVIPDPNRRTVWRNHLRGLLRGWPLAVSHYDDAQARATIAQLIHKEHYDAVVCHMTATSQLLPKNHGCASLLMIEDPQSVKYRNAPPFKDRPFSKPLTQFEIARIEKFERQAWRNFDCVTILNQADLLACRTLYPQARTEWLPYGVDTDFFAPQPNINRDPDKIIFTGQMAHLPNVEAITYFCRDIFPQVVAQRPSAQLWIVGANPAPQVQALVGQDPRIIVTGAVPEMRSHLNSASVSICPVRTPYGSQTKVLEAMSCGLPVVMVAEANVGIGAHPGQHMLMADSAPEFANHILKLLNDPACWQTLSAGAREFILRERSWQAIAPKLENLLEALVHARKHPSHS